MLCIAELVATFRIADGLGAIKPLPSLKGLGTKRTITPALTCGLSSTVVTRERSLMATTRRHAPGHAPAKRRRDLLEGTFQFAGNNIHTSQTSGRPRITIKSRPKQICWRSVSVQSRTHFWRKDYEAHPWK